MEHSKVLLHIVNVIICILGLFPSKEHYLNQQNRILMKLNANTWERCWICYSNGILKGPEEDFLWLHFAYFIKCGDVGCGWYYSKGWKIEKIFSCQLMRTFLLISAVLCWCFYCYCSIRWWLLINVRGWNDLK